MMGDGGMMGGYYNHGGLGTMMSSGNWSWMMGGAWQNMTRQDWQRLQHQLLDTGTNTTSHDGWSMAAMMAALLGGLVLVSLVIVAVIRRPFSRPPTGAPSP
jgi:TRAP-type C4-dicarboxylate transport system permease small subunit